MDSMTPLVNLEVNHLKMPCSWCRFVFNWPRRHSGVRLATTWYQVQPKGETLHSWASLLLAAPWRPRSTRKNQNAHVPKELTPFWTCGNHRTEREAARQRWLSEIERSSCVAIRVPSRDHTQDNQAYRRFRTKTYFTESFECGFAVPFPRMKNDIVYFPARFKIQCSCKNLVFRHSHTPHFEFYNHDWRNEAMLNWEEP